VHFYEDNYVTKYLTIFTPKRTQEKRNGKGKNRIGSYKLREIYFFLSIIFLMLSECGSFIIRWSQKVLVSIYISDYLGHNLVIFSIKDIEILQKGKTSKSSLFHCFYTFIYIQKNSAECKNSPKKLNK